MSLQSLKPLSLQQTFGDNLVPLLQKVQRLTKPGSLAEYIKENEGCTGNAARVKAGHMLMELMAGHIEEFDSYVPGIVQPLAQLAEDEGYVPAWRIGQPGWASIVYCVRTGEHDDSAFIQAIDSIEPEGRQYLRFLNVVLTCVQQHRVHAKLDNAGPEYTSLSMLPGSVYILDPFKKHSLGMADNFNKVTRKTVHRFVYVQAQLPVIPAEHAGFIKG